MNSKIIWIFLTEGVWIFSQFARMSELEDKMIQKKFNNVGNMFEIENLSRQVPSEFQNLFVNESIVNNLRREQMENRVW